jgi:flagellar hook assembly protein FlgD
MDSLRILGNPMRPDRATEIQFAALRPGMIDVSLYDVAGRRVATLVREPYPTGVFRTMWNGRDSNGSALSPGVYFVRLQVDERNEDVERVVMIK